MIRLEVTIQFDLKLAFLLLLEILAHEEHDEHQFDQSQYLGRMMALLNIISCIKKRRERSFHQTIR